MNKTQIIEELKKQKELLGKGFFNEELLEKYLNASIIKKEKYKIFGLNSINDLKGKIDKLYPYKITTSKFKRIQNDQNTLTKLTQKSTKKINISIPSDRQYQKTLKQEKAA